MDRRATASPRDELVAPLEFPGAVCRFRAGKTVSPSFSPFARRLCVTLEMSFGRYWSAYRSHAPPVNGGAGRGEFSRRVPYASRMPIGCDAGMQGLGLGEAGLPTAHGVFLLLLVAANGWISYKVLSGNRLRQHVRARKNFVEGLLTPVRKAIEL